MKNVTHCRHCEKEVAISAEKCPHCGGDSPGLTKEQADAAIAIQQRGGCLVLVVGIVMLVVIIMFARSCWKTGDELERIGKDLMKSTEEMKK
ncbi:MAG: hypothetical protein NT010_04010 [Proteobacteria bacterium]|nr:hypothetical protein [Pseudomonadota bacterium]